MVDSNTIAGIGVIVFAGFAQAMRSAPSGDVAAVAALMPRDVAAALSGVDAAVDAAAALEG